MRKLLTGLSVVVCTHHSCSVTSGGGGQVVLVIVTVVVVVVVVVVADDMLISNMGSFDVCSNMFLVRSSRSEPILWYRAEPVVFPLSFPLSCSLVASRHVYLGSCLIVSSL